MTRLLFQIFAFPFVYWVTCYYLHTYEKSKPLAFVGLCLGAAIFSLLLGHFCGVL